MTKQTDKMIFQLSETTPDSAAELQLALEMVGCVFTAEKTLGQSYDLDGPFNYDLYVFNIEAFSNPIRQGVDIESARPVVNSLIRISQTETTSPTINETLDDSQLTRQTTPDPKMVQRHDELIKHFESLTVIAAVEQ